MARPMNRMRVIAFSASDGVPAASSAWAMARPMAAAGIIAPKAIASTEAAVETRSRRIEEATYGLQAFRHLAANTHADLCARSPSGSSRRL